MFKDGKQTLWGLPIVVSNEVPKGTVFLASFPEPERPNMTIEEYAQQCAAYWYKLRIEDDCTNA